MRSILRGCIPLLAALSCSHAPGGSGAERDSAAPDGASTARPPDADTGRVDGTPACDLAPTDPTAPFAFDHLQEFNLGEFVGGVAVAATPGGRVGLVVSRPSLVYLESLNAGEAFGPLVGLAEERANIVTFAMEKGFAFLTYSVVPPEHRWVFLRRAPLVAGTMLRYEPVVTLSDTDAYSGRLVFGYGQRLAVVYSTVNLATTILGSHVKLSEDAGVTFGPAVPVDPMLSAGPALFDRTGRLHIFQWVMRPGESSLITVRVSDPNVTSFGSPIMREGDGPVATTVGGRFAFATESGEIALMAPYGSQATGRVPILIDRFVPSTGSWGERNVAYDDAPLRCWSAAILDDGRLAVVLKTEGSGSEGWLLVSNDEGHSFSMRQRIAAFAASDSCPTLTTSGRALYLTWIRADKTVAFARAAQPGQACP